MVTINLPIPLLFGSNVSEDWAWVGMPLGIAIVTALGFVLCSGHPAPMRKLCYGSIAVALSQCYPLLHMFVGSIALSICRGLDDVVRLGPNMDGILHVTAATIITGIGLILPSLMLGYFFGLILKMSRDHR